jgi:hypothetical protein
MKDLCFKYLDVKKVIEHEHLRQLDKWGIQDRTPEQWLMYATEELGEMAKAMGEFVHRGGYEGNVGGEAIQTATLCLKIAEMFFNFDKSTAAERNHHGTM